MGKRSERQSNEMGEGFGIINTLIQHQKNGASYSIMSFTPLHHALITPVVLKWSMIEF